MERDCNFCIHNVVCRIKFTLKDLEDTNKGLEFHSGCNQYLPAMNPPEISEEEQNEDTKVEKPKRKTTTKKKTVRRKTK